MLVTNQTNQSYWFGPLHLAAGVGQTLTVDDTTATSLYLTDDAVANTLNNLYVAGMITVSSQAQPFPRATGIPQLLHGDGSPEGLVFAPQGSAYMRRDNTGASSSLYVKTSGVTSATGWQAISTAAIAAPTGIIQMFGGSTVPNDWLLCDGTAVSRTLFSGLFGVIGTLYGAGDGSTTFNVPDLRGRVAVGYAASGGHSDVSALSNNEGGSGNSSTVAVANRRARHPHTNGLSAGHNLTLPNHAHSQSLTLPNHVHTENGTDTVCAFSGGGTHHYTVVSDQGAANPGGELSGDYNTGDPTTNPAIGGSIGNPTSSPAINGSVSLSGTIGAVGTANDAPAYIVVNHIIKT